MTKQAKQLQGVVVGDQGRPRLPVMVITDCALMVAVVVRGHRTEREAAAVGSRTSSCLVLGEKVGKTVYHHYSAAAVVFVVETIAPD